MNIKKDLFNLFKNEKDLFDLYEKIIDYTNVAIKNTKAEENCRFYEYTINLLNSINNAGWEKRHSEQIEYLWKIEKQIVDKYEDYLP